MINEPQDKRKCIPSRPTFNSDNTGSQSPKAPDTGKTQQTQETPQLYMPLTHLGGAILQKGGRGHAILPRASTSEGRRKKKSQVEFLVLDCCKEERSTQGAKLHFPFCSWYLYTSLRTLCHIQGWPYARTESTPLISTHHTEKRVITDENCLQLKTNFIIFFKLSFDVLMIILVH